MRLFVADVETTGLLPSEGHTVCEVGVVPLTLDGDGDWVIGVGDVTFVNPERPIPPEASAVHHILDEDVIGAPLLRHGLAELLPVGVFPPSGKDAHKVIFIAHNAPFDSGFLPLEIYRWIDTYRCALHIWPDAPNHKNMTLYYWLGLHKINADKTSMRGRAHNALTDCGVTALILAAMLNLHHSLEDLIKLSTESVLLKKVGFGTHFGKLWTEVDYGFLKWVSDKDFDQDTLYTVKYEMARRNAANKVIRHGQET